MNKTNIRFECNCKTDIEFARMIYEIHKAETGVNFEIGARLWYTPEGLGKTIMVEYDMTTQDCRDLVENQDEPDWLTAYEVDDEQDCDCSNEIFTETTDNYISISALKEAMTDFAKEVYQRFYSKENDNVSTKKLHIRLISAEICDVFEELLNEYDVTIPSEDREGAESEARIYGEVYSDLETNVTDILATLCEKVKENPDILINIDEIDELKPVSVQNELYVRTFAMKVCELFEGLLDEHDIFIPCEDREKTEDEGRIFGVVYYDLEDTITEVLATLCEKVKKNPDILINIYETDDPNVEICFVEV